jgi:hypothetical protein
MIAEMSEGRWMAASVRKASNGGTAAHVYQFERRSDFFLRSSENSTGRNTHD